VSRRGGDRDYEFLPPPWEPPADVARRVMREFTLAPLSEATLRAVERRLREEGVAFARVEGVFEVGACRASLRVRLADGSETALA